jgi:hypothetical protein
MFAQVLSGPPVRLDGPVVVHDFEDHVRSQTRTGLMELLGAPYANDSAEDEFFTQETQERVRGVIAGLSPFDRALATAQFGLAGEPVEQKHLYNGVYRDATGNVFTVEETVRKAWDANNPDNLAQTAKQVELNRLFKEGKLRWEPMTREAQQLSQLLAAERSADDVGQMVGVPLTSGIVQDRLEHLALKLAADENLLVDRPRYRGDFELQNSGTACELVRRALSVVGALSATEAATLKAGRANMKEGEVGKSPLTAAAVKQGWVSEQTGKVNWTQLHEDVRARKREVARSRNGLESTDELAELMASA